jgi:oligopeptide transport system permease protein
MGTTLVASIAKRDYSMIMGLALLYTFILTMANLIVDLMYGVVDPRISVK